MSPSICCISTASARLSRMTPPTCASASQTVERLRGDGRRGERPGVRRRRCLRSKRSSARHHVHGATRSGARKKSGWRQRRLSTTMSSSSNEARASCSTRSTGGPWCFGQVPDLLPNETQLAGHDGTYLSLCATTRPHQSDGVTGRFDSYAWISAADAASWTATPNLRRPY